MDIEQKIQIHTRIFYLKKKDKNRRKCGEETSEKTLVFIPHLFIASIRPLNKKSSRFFLLFSLRRAQYKDISISLKYDTLHE